MFYENTNNTKFSVDFGYIQLDTPMSLATRDKVVLETDIFYKNRTLEKVVLIVII